MFWVVNFKGIFKQIVNIKNAQIIFINVFFFRVTYFAPNSLAWPIGHVYQEPCPQQTMPSSNPPPWRQTTPARSPSPSSTRQLRTPRPHATPVYQEPCPPQTMPSSNPPPCQKETAPRRQTTSTWSPSTQQYSPAWHTTATCNPCLPRALPPTNVNLKPFTQQYSPALLSTPRPHATHVYQEPCPQQTMPSSNPPPCQEETAPWRQTTSTWSPSTQQYSPAQHTTATSNWNPATLAAQNNISRKHTPPQHTRTMPT